MPKDLKNIIKQYVRESLVEIFAEMKLETIVENVLNKKAPIAKEAPQVPSFSVKEVMYGNEQANRSPNQSILKEQMKRSFMDKVGVSDGEWNKIYADIDTNNPIMTGEQNPVATEVPEDVLAKMGLMKDYSKHINVSSGGSKAVEEEDDEWQKRREEFQKRISVAKRASNGQ